MCIDSGRGKHVQFDIGTEQYVGSGNVGTGLDIALQSPKEEHGNIYFYKN
jgi:hypothetical protein